MSVSARAPGGIVFALGGGVPCRGGGTSSQGGPSAVCFSSKDFRVCLWIFTVLVKLEGGLPGLPWRALSRASPRWRDAGPSRPEHPREAAPRALRQPLLGASSAAFPVPGSRAPNE